MRAALIVGLSVLASFVGCGDGDTNATATPSATVQRTPTKTPPPAIRGCIEECCGDAPCGSAPLFCIGDALYCACNISPSGCGTAVCYNPRTPGPIEDCYCSARCPGL